MGYSKGKIFIGTMFLTFALLLADGVSAKDSPRSKFYDFSDQLIDGQIKKPTTLYVDSRERVKFERLLKLKKSFLNKLFKTARERVFK